MTFKYKKTNFSSSKENFTINLNKIPEFRRKKALSFKFFEDQVLSVESFILLLDLLKSENADTKNLEFSYSENGKPFFKDLPDIHFNISHCKKAFACAVDNNPVGIDVEEIPCELDLELVNYAFNDEEVKLILESENPVIKFTELWTKKEAYLKLKGTGLSEDVKNVLKNVDLNKFTFTTFQDPQKEFVITVCSIIL